MNRLIIIGASGHGKVVANIATLNGYKDIIFLDDNESVKECGGYPVVGNSDDAENMVGDIFVAIGKAQTRKKIIERFEKRKCPILVHPSAVIADTVEIGEGSVIMAGAVINPGVRVGQGVIVNTSSSIDHDCIIGDYSHVSVGAHLCGTVLIGDSVWIGSGATISNNVNICNGCMIGAGAVVIKDVDMPGIYAGVPVKLIKSHN